MRRSPAQSGASAAPAPEPALRVDPTSGVPVVVQLREQLTWLIAMRAVQPGDRLPSIRNLAARVGVHHHTVRAAYLQLKSDGLLAIRPGTAPVVLPFSSLQLARPRIAARPTAIGVLIADFDPFYLPFLRGVEEVADRIRALTTVCVTEDSPVKARIQLDQLIARGVSGIITASVGQLVRDQLQPGGAPGGVPIVYCDMPDQGGHAFHFDAASAGYELAGHLGSHGHARVTLLTPSVEAPNMAALVNGFRRAEIDGTIQRLDVFVTDDFALESGEAAARRLLDSTDHPTAIACAGNMLAIGVLRGAREAGIRVPEDLAVVGYGQIEAAELVDPPLTTVVTPIHEMGQLAADRLDRLMRGVPTRPRTVIMPTKLVIRRSCGCSFSAPGGSSPGRATC